LTESQNTVRGSGSGPWR